MRTNLTCLLGVLCAVLLLAACSDDDNGGVCGDGVVQEGESCDGAALGGQDCTTVAGNFTGGTLACSASCTLDTSACTSAAADCGNGVIDSDEDCDGSELGGATCSSVGNYSGGTLTCSASCTFDTARCTPASTDCGNDEIDSGEDCDGSELGGATCATVPGADFTGGTLACANDCSFDTSACTSDCGNGTIDPGEDCEGADLGGMTCATLPGDTYSGGELACNSDCSFDTAGCVANGDPSAQLQAVLEIDDGEGLNLPVSGALVTYTKEALGNDVAGFFLQAEQSGPALFVAVDPATLTPPAAVGDEVALTVTAKSTSAALAQATAISGYSQLSSGNDVTGLAQDLSSATDLVTGLGDYAAELVTVSGTVAERFFYGGLEHETAFIETTGISDDDNLRLRLPATLRESLGLAALCSFTVTATPLWRFADQAQVSAWQASEVSGISCPQIELSCDNGVDGDQNGYIDCLDSACANDAACTFASQLYLWELDSDQAGSDAGEFVEIYNNTGAAVDFDTGKYFLLLVNGANEHVYFALQLTGTLAPGEVHLLGNSGVLGIDQLIPDTTIQNGPDGALLVRCDDCTDADSDFPTSFTMVAGTTFTSAGGATATKIDALAYDTGDDDNASLLSVLGVTAQFDEDRYNASASESLQRVAPDRWVAVPTPTPGEAARQ